MIKFMIRISSIYLRSLDKIRRRPFAFVAVACSLTLVYTGLQDYATRTYLKGFSDAIVPSSASPEQKAEFLLAWMGHAPGKRSLDDRDFRLLDPRDPLETLNNRHLLTICGTAVNAFLNLARLAGLQVRPLILLGKNYAATHVVAELRLPQGWIVIDPTFRRVMRDAQGRALSSADLRDSRLLKEATVGLKNYLPVYTYERTTHIHLEKVPFLGGHLRKALNSLYPNWEDLVSPLNWILDCRSTLRALVAAFVTCVSWLAFFVSYRWATRSRPGPTKTALQVKNTSWAMSSGSVDTLS